MRISPLFFLMKVVFRIEKCRYFLGDTQAKVRKDEHLASAEVGLCSLEDALLVTVKTDDKHSTLGVVVSARWGGANAVGSIQLRG